jgi:hypothetical protein
LTWRRAIVIGTLIVGTLDALDAIVVFGLHSGATPGGIFRTIASGVLGSRAATGGPPAAILGFFLHYTVALGIVTTYVGVSHWLLPVLTRRPFVYGPLYGVVAFFVMNLVVIPLSAIGATPHFTIFATTNGLLIHAFGVGLPTALIAAHVTPRRPPQREEDARASWRPRAAEAPAMGAPTGSMVCRSLCAPRKDQREMRCHDGDVGHDGSLLRRLQDASDRRRRLAKATPEPDFR